LVNVLKDMPLDYVLGSVHYIDGWGFDNPDYISQYDSMDIEKLYRRYFQLLKQAALSGIFDILAHPDLIKKFGYFPARDMTQVYEDTVQAIHASNVCIEVNTAGLRVPAREIYPTEEFLQLCCRYGVPVTLGSDAHKPEQVGWGFAEAVKLLKKVGYRETVLFTERQRKFIALE
jgi:histidinol-phosphatase (PHP family)